MKNPQLIRASRNLNSLREPNLLSKQSTYNSRIFYNLMCMHCAYETPVRFPSVVAECISWVQTVVGRWKRDSAQCNSAQHSEKSVLVYPLPDEWRLNYTQVETRLQTITDSADIVLLLLSMKIQFLVNFYSYKVFCYLIESISKMTCLNQSSYA